ncbi:uncharacterized protein BXZ73DRAFT_47782, partial [Epithele typhae]|uniref:uncharacterized protein n=1 Tax=Epithele typhae TaxID=378194 RepID=UPI002008336A
KSILGRMYKCADTSSSPAHVSTTIDRKRDSLSVPRYPGLEAYLGQRNLLEAWVLFTDETGQEQRCLVGAVYHRSVQARIRNRAVEAILPDVPWYGDIIVMLGGRHYSIINMRRPHHRELGRRAVEI